MAAAKGLFQSRTEWLYLAGHYSGQQLYSEDSDTTVTFNNGSIDVTAQGQTAQLKKSDGTFTLHNHVKVIIWGGCSMLGYEDDVKMMRDLFGPNHVMLGFAGLTGWRIVQAMFGGGFIPKRQSFFARLTARSTPHEIVCAWMETAQAGYGGGDIENKFRAVDEDGQAWRLSNKRIVKA